MTGRASITHGELAQVLADAGATLGAAEVHGCVSGALCAAPLVAPDGWLEEVMPGDVVATGATAVRAALDGLITQTRLQLAGGEMEFTPLLPHEDRPLEDRVAALAAWCGGFLYGLGRCALPDPPEDELRELLRDFGEISRAGLGTDEGGEDAERDFVELVEYVRASVQLAFEELAPRRATGGGTAGTAPQGDAR